MYSIYFQMVQECHKIARHVGGRITGWWHVTLAVATEVENQHPELVNHCRYDANVPSGKASGQAVDQD
jgi:hypothetical protein